MYWRLGIIGTCIHSFWDGGGEVRRNQKGRRMASATPSSFTANTGTAAAGDPKFDLMKQIRSHEVAIAELNALSSSRVCFIKFSEFGSIVLNQKMELVVVIWLDGNCS